MIRQQSKPEIFNSNVVRERDELLKHNQKKNFCNHYGAREMEPLSIRQLVWLPDSRVEAHVEG